MAQIVISRDILRKEIVDVLNAVELQIKEIREEAERLGVRPEQLVDSNNNWVMSPLLLAKVQALSTLVELNKPRVGQAA